ncbi:helix-turn-helix transcriptional regulator [Peribacillus simplex]|uniref:helix-turn-helix transcriptional regulator n=1 Tax=Peribacillus simplex TaxID=1478 RepID=UPI00298E5B19|nr:helix-turn-helix transcriptional regulator [Peribacillus simplex]
MVEKDKFIAIRTYLDMSVPNFAGFLNVSSSNVYMIENGSRRITKNMVGKIAKVFKETEEFQEFYARTKKLVE